MEHTVNWVEDGILGNHIVVISGEFLIVFLDVENALTFH